MFREIKDVLSGRIARENKLVTSGVERVIARISHLPEDSPLRHYVSANLLAVSVFMNSIFFETPEDLSPFRKFQRSISEQQARDFFVLMTARYLVMFLQNAHNVAWIKREHGPVEDFVQQVLQFSGEGDSTRGLFPDLREALEDAEKSGNPAAWTFRVFRHAQHLALGMPFEGLFDPFAAETFTRLSSLAYTDVLFPRLAASIKS